MSLILAQYYYETQRFSLTYERSPVSTVSGGAFYRGRGLIQLTHDYNYTKFQKYIKNNELLSSFAPKVAKEIELACKASGYYWKNLGVKYKDINILADKDDTLSVSQDINGYGKGGPNGYNERVEFTNLLKIIMKYERCSNKK